MYEIFINHRIDMYVLWCSRKYFDELSDEYYEKVPTMLTIYITVETMRGRLDKVDELTKRLGKTEAELDITKLNRTDVIRIMVELIFPHLSIEEFVRRVKFILQIIREPLRGFDLNACRPSIISGFRDFTKLCPELKDKKENILHIIQTIYGSSSKGIYDIALAEWEYEIGNTFEALVIIAGTIPLLEETDDIRCLFVSYVLQMKILIMNNQTQSLEMMYERINKKIEDTKYEELCSSIKAVKCMYDCYKGDYEGVKKWLDTDAPSEYEEIFMMDMYSYF